MNVAERIKNLIGASAAPFMEASGRRRLTTKELATLWGVDPGTLRNWRSKKIGPKAIKIGRAVRYKLVDVIAYEKKWTAR